VSQPLCPNCDVPLAPVTARARTGYLLALDQCSRCGGVWCDRWELFPLAAAEAERLDPVDQPALWSPVATVKRDLKCPRCRTPLRRFRDPLLPEDAHIERCAACEGMWLNRGELRRFKSRRPSAAQPAALLDPQIHELSQRYASAANWPTVSNLSAATSPAAPPEPEAESADIKRELMWGAAWWGLRALLRLLLHI